MQSILQLFDEMTIEAASFLEYQIIKQKKKGKLVKGA